MADIPMLAGWDSGLSNLPQLGQNLRDIFNPNYNIQQLFKAAIAKDPSILQTMANTPNAPNVLQNLGFGNAIANSVGSIGVDPTTQLQRQKATAESTAFNADPTLRNDAVSMGLTGQTASTRTLESSRARVATATEGSQISQAASDASIAKNQVTITKKAADDAMREMSDNAEALTKFPTLAGININQLAQRIVSGQAVDPALIQRVNMDPAAGKALEQFQSALMQHMDMANRMSVAQITSNREYAGLALQYLGGQQTQMRMQVQTAADIVKNSNPTFTERAIASAPPKDKNDQASMSLYLQAKEKVDNYNTARQMISADSPLMKSLDALDQKTGEIAQAIGTVTMPGVTTKNPAVLNPGGTQTGGTSGTKVSVSSQGNGLNAQQLINSAIDFIKSGKGTLADLNNDLKNGKLTQSQYNAIKSGLNDRFNNTLDSLDKTNPSSTRSVRSLSRQQLFDPNVP